MGLTEVEKKQIEAEEYRKLIREKLKENQDGRQSGNVSDVQSEASSLKKLAGCLNVFLLLLLPHLRVFSVFCCFRELRTLLL